MAKLRDHPMTNKEYRERDGAVCPFCESQDIVGGSWDEEGVTTTQEVDCSECGASWLDFYKLQGYDIQCGPDEDQEERERHIS